MDLIPQCQATYLQPIANPERQPGGGRPGVDEADLTLLQIVQGEQANGPAGSENPTWLFHTVCLYGE